MVFPSVLDQPSSLCNGHADVHGACGTGRRFGRDGHGGGADRSEVASKFRGAACEADGYDCGDQKKTEVQLRLGKTAAEMAVAGEGSKTEEQGRQPEDERRGGRAGCGRIEGGRRRGDVGDDREEHGCRLVVAGEGEGGDGHSVLAEEAEGVVRQAGAGECEGSFVTTGGREGDVGLTDLALCDGEGVWDGDEVKCGADGSGNGQGVAGDGELIVVSCLWR